MSLVLAVLRTWLLWMIWMTILLSGCTNGFTPSGAVLFQPPLSYRLEYAHTKECAKADVPAVWMKPFETFRFWSVPEPFYDEDGDTELAGMYDRDGDIYINERYLDQAWVLRHEFIHTFGFGNDHPPVFERCRATWETRDTTRLAL